MVLDDLALLRRIVIPLIVVADAVRHVVHGRGRDRLDARIIRRCRDGHARETADANGTDLLRVDELEVADEIDCRAVIFREDLRRAHIAALAAALSRGRRIEGDGNKTILGHLLCVEDRGLLLDCAERARHDDSLVLLLVIKILRQVEVARHIEAVAVLERDLLGLNRLVHSKDARVVVQILDRRMLHL